MPRTYLTMAHLTLILGLLLISGGPLLADSVEVCGTPDPTEAEMKTLPYYGNNALLAELVDGMRLLARVQEKSAAEPGVAARIPVHFWIYRRSDGTGGPNREDLQLWMDELNRSHRENGSPLRFYQKCGLNFIDNDNHLVVGDFEGFLLSAAATGRKATGAVNIHVVQDLNGSRGVYHSLSDSILVRWDSPESTIAHEVGHYLGLNHPHRGAHYPLWLPGGRCVREPVSRTARFGLRCLPGVVKCEITGDALCDTPADPDLSEYTPDDDEACEYNHEVTDYRGDRYSPDTRNIMSYSWADCRNRFSPGQVGAMVGSQVLDPRRPAEWFANARNAFDPFEPDNAPEIARTIGLGETQEHSFHWEYLGRQNGRDTYGKCDEDWVSFVLDQTTPVEIFTAELDGPPRPNTILELYDESLNLLAENDDALMAGGFSRIDRTLPPGTYFVRVTNKSGFDHPDSRGHYLLTVQRCPECCFNLALSGIQQVNPSTGPFNLGARAAAWTDFVPQDIEVTGVALTFNVDRPLDFGGPGVPTRQSHLTAHLCDGADLTFRSDGRLEVGDPGSAGLRADVRVDAGSVVTLAGGGSGTVHARSRLIVGSGGRLVLEDGGALGVRPDAAVVVEAGGVLEIRSRGHLAAFGNGRVTVLPGGRLVYRPRAEIRLEGHGAVLDLRGDLEIAAGALFTFSFQNTSGYVRFDLPAKGCTPKPDYLACPNVRVNGPSQMLFRGAGREDKILEVAAPLHPEAALLRLTVVQGRVELAANGEIQIDEAQLVVNNVDFVGTGGGIALDWPFAFINSQPLLFDGVGVRARGNGTAGPVLTIRNSEFRNASLPLFTEDLRVRLEDVRMSGHEFGWLGVGLVGRSEVVDSVIDGGGAGATGIDLLEGSGATVRVVRSEVAGHGIAGIHVIGGIRVEVECGTVTDNSRGFFLGNGASLDMSSLSGNGNVDASDNVLTIELDDAGELVLEDGHNILAARVSQDVPQKSPAPVIRGTLEGPLCDDLSLDATGNTWNQGQAFPGPGIRSRNTSVTSTRPGCAGAPIAVVDSQPAGPGSCEPEPPDLCDLIPLLCPSGPAFPRLPPNF